jgi:hypothetical protein
LDYLVEFAVVVSLSRLVVLKRRPEFRHSPALLAFDEGFRRAIPGSAKTSGLLPVPIRAYFAKSCDARGGITGGNPFASLKAVVDLNLGKIFKMLPTIGGPSFATDALHFVQPA